MKKNRILLAAFFILFAYTFSHAQNQYGRMRIDDLHEKKWEFFVQQINLSPAESNAIKPFFLEYEKNIWQLHKQTRDIFQKSKSANLTENDYNEINEKMINIELQRMQLLRDYHLKLKEQIKPFTLFQYYLTEKKYEQHLLQTRQPMHNKGKKR